MSLLQFFTELDERFRQQDELPGFPGSAAGTNQELLRMHEHFDEFVEVRRKLRFDAPVERFRRVLQHARDRDCLLHQLEHVLEMPVVFTSAVQ